MRFAHYENKAVELRIADLRNILRCPPLVSRLYAYLYFRIGAGELVCFFAGVEVEGEGAEDQNLSEYSISLQGSRRLDIPENLR